MKDEWIAGISPLASGQEGIITTLHCGNRPLSFGDLFELLASSARFARWYSSILLDSGYPAFFWEHPPLFSTNLSDPAEFVLLDAPTLASLRPDPNTFAEHFARAERRKSDYPVIRFENLGGDALLVVPCPDKQSEQYPHLAAFLRCAPAPQILEFWRVTANAVIEKAGRDPLWLSTSGLGVAWLHVRLDSRPKYYQYRPYKNL